MARHKSQPRPGTHARRSIASLAARMMAQDGIDNYGYAKRKAARNLGMADGEELPTNDEVSAELRAYQSLYQEDEHRQRLCLLRRNALELMNILDDFRPYLTGSVLDGTAGRYAEIELLLYTDNAKDVEFRMLAKGIEYEAVSARGEAGEGADVQLRLEFGGIPVLISVFPFIQERQQRRNPRTGRSTQRARPDAVAALLEPAGNTA